MVNEVKQASIDAAAPTASIEALLHAFIPARFVLHSHADAIVALTDQSDSMERVRGILGEQMLVMPYIMPGFDLARAVAASQEVADGKVDAIVLSNHGLFTFADEGDQALNRHLELVDRASHALGIESWGHIGADIDRAGGVIGLAQFRTELSKIAGRPMIVRQSASGRAAEFSKRPDAAKISSRGTATPEHLIRTKRSPLIGRDLQQFSDGYRRYVLANQHVLGDIVEIDAAPRVVLDPEWGMLTAGETVKDTSIAADIFLHTMDIIDAADKMSEYMSIGEADSFKIEYWSLEQIKLQIRSLGSDFRGEVAIVTGAASGIGRACAQEVLDRGAAVVGIDLNSTITSTFETPAWRGVIGDVSDTRTLAAAAETAVRDFGGVDILVVVAGTFPESASLSELNYSLWDRSPQVNTTAVVRAFREMYPFLKLAPRGGRAVLVSAKNVVAPGLGAAAYSASKTAAAQLARIAALEWAPDGIRVNQVELDAVFETRIWTPELLKARAARYALTVEEYKARNLLGLEIASRDVAKAAIALCTSTFAATTGAHISVDGGNDRVI